MRILLLAIAIVTCCVSRTNTQRSSHAGWGLFGPRHFSDLPLRRWNNTNGNRAKMQTPQRSSNSHQIHSSIYGESYNPSTRRSNGNNGTIVQMRSSLPSIPDDNWFFPSDDGRSYYHASAIRRRNRNGGSVDSGYKKEETVNYGVTDAEKHHAGNLVLRRINRFAFKFLQEIAQQTQTGNYVFSPISTALVLAMATYGSRGRTRTELESVLNLPSNATTAKIGFQKLIDTMNSLDNVELRFTNKVFVDMRRSLRPDYVEITSNAFRSKAATLDFRDRNKAAQIINNWAAAQTENVIKEVVTPDSLQTQIVLANALFFKGNWARSFDDRRTEPRRFYNEGLHAVKVDTMYRKGSYRYGELVALKARFISIPFSLGHQNSPDVLMHVILPKERTGIVDLEKCIGNLRLYQLDGDLYDVELYMPKFNLTNIINLDAPLARLGLSEFFTDLVDLSGIASGQFRGITVEQNAFLNLDEIGARAGAVTYTSESRSIERSGPLKTEFRAEHPFLCIIAMDSTPLAIARYSGPGH